MVDSLVWTELVFSNQESFKKTHESYALLRVTIAAFLIAKKYELLKNMICFCSAPKMVSYKPKRCQNHFGFMRHIPNLNFQWS